MIIFSLVEPLLTSISFLYKPIGSFGMFLFILPESHMFFLFKDDLSFQYKYRR